MSMEAARRIPSTSPRAEDHGFGHAIPECSADREAARTGSWRIQCPTQGVVARKTIRIALQVASVGSTNRGIGAGELDARARP